MTRFEILQGLPPYGQTPEQFSATGGGKHREGFVIRFFKASGADWVGNFQPGLTTFSTVVEHPNGSDAIVVSGGQGYIVNPLTRSLRAEFGGQIEAIKPIPQLQLLVFATPCWLEVISKTEIWRSRRVSWDGIQKLSLQDCSLIGEAYSPLDNQWHAFSLDLVTRQVEGGSYDVPD